MHHATALSRRGFLARGSALIVSFSLLPGKALAQGASKKKPDGPNFGDLKKSRYLDSWLAIDDKGHVTVFTGKAELGQGIKTALMQCAAEQLAVEPGAITMVMASTTKTPNEGYTAGSNSMMASGTAIFHAASQARNILLGWAATDLGVDAAQLKAENGTITGPGNKKRRAGHAHGQHGPRAGRATAQLRRDAAPCRYGHSREDAGRDQSHSSGQLSRRRGGG
jgi:CO/xanthine dehydrogenase Mo-binding subunit